MKEVLTTLAARIDPQGRLADAALAEQTRQELIQILRNLRATESSGVVLFHGPGGTGKTMAALALAGELGRQVMRIDLSRVVSKYIGETEKQLDAVFEDAQRSSAVLLFEEADALFGKRGEVKDSNDRFANIDISYLLQRLESYEGLAILTSNSRQNIDAAFVHRLRFVVEFPCRS